MFASLRIISLFSWLTPSIYGFRRRVHKFKLLEKNSLRRRNRPMFYVKVPGCKNNRTQCSDKVLPFKRKNPLWMGQIKWRRKSYIVFDWSHVTVWWKSSTPAYLLAPLWSPPSREDITWLLKRCKCFNMFTNHLLTLCVQSWAGSPTKCSKDFLFAANSDEKPCWTSEMPHVSA